VGSPDLTAAFYFSSSAMQFFEKWNASWSTCVIFQDSLPYPEDKCTKIILQALYVKAKRENCPTEVVVVLGPGNIQPESYVKD
jgi:hypothetical protein